VTAQRESLAVEAGRDYIAGMTPMTAEDLERLYIPGKKVELVRGVPVVQELPSTLHGFVAGVLFQRLALFVGEQALGLVFLQDTGFKIASNPDTVRGPDVAFVSRERMPELPRRGYVPIAPDLVAEVVSPNDTLGEVLSKAGEWLRAGCRLVWVIDPDHRRARIYRADGSESLLGPQDLLEGEEVVPGFSCPLQELLNA
jgi:Uma2 family endonuclease